MKLKMLINIYRTSELLCYQNREKSWRGLFSSLEVFLGPNKWETKLLQSTPRATAQERPSVGKDTQTSTASCPFQGCAHTFGWAKQGSIHRLFSTQPSQSTVLFWDRSSSTFPRVICVFGIKRLRFGVFFPNGSKKNSLEVFFPLYSITLVLTQSFHTAVADLQELNIEEQWAGNICKSDTFQRIHWVIQNPF